MSLTIHQPLERILPAEALAHMNLWATRMQQLVAAGRGWTKLAEQLAPEWGASYGTITRYYYAYQKHGPAGLVDARKYGKYLNTNASNRSLPPAFIEEWKALNEQAQRGNSGAASYRLIMDKLKAWRRGDQSCRIAGYDAPPPNQPGKSHPAGWSYENLMRLLPNKAELTLARIGGRAASKYMPMIYTTRVGLEPGQVIVIDDQWHDVEVVWNNGQTGRPLSFDLLDLAAAYHLIDGIMPRLKTEEGKRIGLKEQDAFWLILTHLMRNGYRADIGTTIITEAGTASYSAAIAEGLRQASGGKILTSKGDTHNPGIKGMIFEGTRKGNYRFKASRESLFALYRSMSSHLIGGTGKDIAHAPEEHENIKKYVAALIKQVPEERRHLLRLPLLTEDQYRAIMADMKHVLNHRTWHNLEGWERAGYMTTEFLLPGADPEDESAWQPLETLQQKLLQLPADKAETLALALSSGNMTRTRKLSPAEVWHKHEHKLTKLTPWHMHMIVPASMAHVRPVEDNREIRIYGLGSEVLRYDAFCDDNRGLKIPLTPRREFLVYVNPFSPDIALVCDTNGAPIGTINRIIPFTRVDVASYLRRQKEVTAMKQDIVAAVTRRAEPIARDRQAMWDHNERVIKGLPVTAEEHEAHDLHERAKATAAELFEADQEPVPTPTTPETTEDEPDLSSFFDS